MMERKEACLHGRMIPEQTLQRPSFDGLVYKAARMINI